jgi:hypothetical protein
MLINEGRKRMPGPARRAAALRAAALAAVCLWAQGPASADGSDGAGGAVKAARPAAISREAKVTAEPKVKVASKSPYAAWRAQREQAEKPDTSGHGHRAPRPEGQSRSRRLPQ